MILKYQQAMDDESTAWVYMGGVFRVTPFWANADAYIKQYNEEVETGKREDCASDVGYSADVAASIKVVEVAHDKVKELGWTAIRSALDAGKLKDQSGIWLICIEFENDKPCDVVLTNQTAYLMNDRGQTIERLC
jgi:hypothetical protein